MTNGIIEAVLVGLAAGAVVGWFIAIVMTRDFPKRRKRR